MPSPPARQRSREHVGALRKDVTEHPPRVWSARVPTSMGLTLLLQLLRTPPRTGGFGPAASVAWVARCEHSSNGERWLGRARKKVDGQMDSKAVTGNPSTSDTAMGNLFYMHLRNNLGL